MKRILVSRWARLNVARGARVPADPMPVLVGAALAALLLLLWLTASPSPARTARHDTELAALPSLSIAHTNTPAFRRHYPQGQLQADLHTLVNMMRFALTPELSDPTNASAARV